MIVRPARPSDAVSIASVHVSAWRSAYAGILPDDYLARLSLPRQAFLYDAGIRARGGVFVAIGEGDVVGFITAGRARRTGIADGEVETLYVLDDWRDRGVGRRLLHAAAAYLKAQGCGSAFLWVLRDNPGRWFYQRMGGRPGAEAVASVAGVQVQQIAYVWNPIEMMMAPGPARPESLP